MSGELRLRRANAPDSSDALEWWTGSEFLDSLWEFMMGTQVFPAYIDRSSVKQAKHTPTVIAVRNTLTPAVMSLIAKGQFQEALRVDILQRTFGSPETPAQLHEHHNSLETPVELPWCSGPSLQALSVLDRDNLSVEGFRNVLSLQFSAVDPEILETIVTTWYVWTLHAGWDRMEDIQDFDAHMTQLKNRLGSATQASDHARLLPLIESCLSRSVLWTVKNPRIPELQSSRDVHAVSETAAVEHKLQDLAHQQRQVLVQRNIFKGSFSKAAAHIFDLLLQENTADTISDWVLTLWQQYADFTEVKEPEVAVKDGYAHAENFDTPEAFLLLTRSLDKALVHPDLLKRKSSYMLLRLIGSWIMRVDLQAAAAHSMLTSMPQLLTDLLEKGLIVLEDAKKANILGSAENRILTNLLVSIAETGLDSGMLQADFVLATLTMLGRLMVLDVSAIKKSVMHICMVSVQRGLVHQVISCVEFALEQCRNWETLEASARLVDDVCGVFETVYVQMNNFQERHIFQTLANFAQFRYDVHEDDLDAFVASNGNDELNTIYAASLLAVIAIDKYVESPHADKADKEVIAEVKSHREQLMTFIENTLLLSRNLSLLPVTARPSLYCVMHVLGRYFGTLKQVKSDEGRSATCVLAVRNLVLFVHACYTLPSSAEGVDLNQTLMQRAFLCRNLIEAGDFRMTLEDSRAIAHCLHNVSYGLWRQAMPKLPQFTEPALGATASSTMTWSFVKDLYLSMLALWAVLLKTHVGSEPKVTLTPATTEEVEAYAECVGLCLESQSLVWYIVVEGFSRATPSVYHEVQDRCYEQARKYDMKAVVGRLCQVLLAFAQPRGLGGDDRVTDGRHAALEEAATDHIVHIVFKHNRKSHTALLRKELTHELEEKLINTFLHLLQRECTSKPARYFDLCSQIIAQSSDNQSSNNGMEHQRVAKTMVALMTKHHNSGSITDDDFRMALMRLVPCLQDEQIYQELITPILEHAERDLHDLDQRGETNVRQSLYLSTALDMVHTVPLQNLQSHWEWIALTLEPFTSKDIYHDAVRYLQTGMFNDNDLSRKAYNASTILNVLEFNEESIPIEDLALRREDNHDDAAAAEPNPAEDNAAVSASIDIDDMPALLDEI
eukprot:Clim_evm9s17 gene=Clim_evmTU9s17